MAGPDHKHHSGLVTILFTDMVGSTALKQRLGDRASSEFFDQHHQIVRQTLAQFPNGQEIETAGDSFLITFAAPSDAVQFALLLQSRLQPLFASQNAGALDRIGIYVGEVVIKENRTGAKPRDLFGIPIDTCARIMSLATGGQTLMSRFAFDSARPMLRSDQFGALQWLNHGPFQLKGIDDPIEVCEVRPAGAATNPPTSSDKATRLTTDGNLVLGWRPALEQLVPNTRWKLIAKLGEGGFGEVWLGQHEVLKEKRVFKFCFKAELVRSLKRELTLFRLLKEKVGEHPNIAAIREVNFDTAPFYIEMDYVPGHDLKAWWETKGRPAQILESNKLEIISQIADALQAAHQCGIVHRDVKPGNILISNLKSEISNSDSLIAKLSDFGIGQVLSEEFLAGTTRAGFTQTMLGTSTSGTGTQMYMAPELLAGKPASPRSDIYSLGVVLYQLLIGDFSQALTIDWTRRITDPLLRDDLEKCLAGDPNERFGSAAELARNLRNLPNRRAALQRSQADLAERERAAYREGMLKTAGWATVLILIFGTLSIIAYNLYRTARAARIHATSLAASEKDQRLRSQTQELAAKRRSYAADMNLVQQALAANNLFRARSLLDRHRPKKGELDLRGWEWRYFWQNSQGNALVKLFQQPLQQAGDFSTPRVSFTAFTSDGKVAIFDDPGTVSLWDIATRAEVRRLQDKGLQGGGAFPNSGQACLSLDGKYLAAVAIEKGSKIARCWDLTARQIIAEFPINQPATSALALSPNHKLLAAYSHGFGVSIWDVSTKTNLKILPVPEDALRWRGALQFSPDGALLAIGDAAPDDGPVRLIDVKTFAEVGSFMASSTDGVMALAFSPNSRVLAVSSAFTNPRITIWDVAAKTKITTLEGHKGFVSSLNFSPDGSLLASSSGDQTIKLWNTATWKNEATLTGHDDEVWSVNFSRDGKNLVSGGKDGAVYLWPAELSRLDRGHTAINVSGWRCSFSPSGKSFVAVLMNGSIALWDIASATSKPVPKQLGTNNVDAGWTSQGTIVLGSQNSPQLKFWDPTTDAVSEYALSPDIKEPNFWFLRQSGQILITHTNTGAGNWTFRYWDTSTHREVSSFPVQKALDFNSADLSANEHLIAVKTGLGGITVLNLPTGEEFAALTPFQGGLQGLALFPDGKALATASTWGRGAKVIELPSGRELAHLAGHNLVLSDIAVSGDARRVATCTIGDEPIKLWDTTSWEETANIEIPGHVFHVRGFLPDGNTLVAMDRNNFSLHFWRAPSWEEISTAESK